MGRAVEGVAVVSHDDGTNVLVRFDGVQAETEKAVCIVLDATDYEGVWIPRSQIAHIDEDAGELWIPLWFAEKKGLDYE